MSSGFGFRGAEGRCYQFWKDVEECSRNSEVAGLCEKQVEDYIECLHRRKEYKRQSAIQVQKERNAKEATDTGHH